MRHGTACGAEPGGRSVRARTPARYHGARTRTDHRPVTRRRWPPGDVLDGMVASITTVRGPDLHGEHIWRCPWPGPPGLSLPRSSIPCRSIRPPPFSSHDLAAEPHHEHLEFQEAPDLVKAACCACAPEENVVPWFLSRTPPRADSPQSTCVPAVSDLVKAACCAGIGRRLEWNSPSSMVTIGHWIRQDQAVNGPVGEVAVGRKAEVMGIGVCRRGSGIRSAVGGGHNVTPPASSSTKGAPPRLFWVCYSMC
jgi:hypothetical protein